MHAAGAIVQELEKRLSEGLQMNDSAAIARNAAAQLLDAAANPNAILADYFATTQGGRNLIGINQQADLPLCAAISSSRCIPRLDIRSGELRTA